MQSVYVSIDFINALSVRLVYADNGNGIHMRVDFDLFQGGISLRTWGQGCRTMQLCMDAQ